MHQFLQFFHAIVTKQNYEDLIHFRFTSLYFASDELTSTRIVTHRGQVDRVHLVARYPIPCLVLLILAVRRHHAEKVQKCPECLAVWRRQQLNEMLKCLLLKSPVPDLCGVREPLLTRVRNLARQCSERKLHRRTRDELNFYFNPLHPCKYSLQRGLQLSTMD